MVPPFLLQANNLRPREGRQLAQGHTSDSRAGPEPELKLEPTTEAMKSLPAHVAHGKLRLRGHCTEPSWYLCPILRQAGPPRVMPGSPLTVFSIGVAKKTPPALFPPTSPEGAATLT